MTTHISQQASETKWSSSIIQMWNSFIKADESLNEDQRQKASSLIALTLVFIPLAFFTVIASPLVSFFNGTGFTTPNFGGVVALIIACVAYGFSRTKYYQVGAYMIITVPIIAIVVAEISSGGTISEIALFYLSLTVILASLLVSANGTIASGVVASVVLFIAHSISSSNGNTTTSPVVILMFIIVTTGVLALVSVIRERNFTKLEATQKQLEQSVKEEAEARLQAERSDQVKSVFLASMSHELRTPLNAIINFSRFIAQGDVGPVNAEQETMLTDVMTSAKHLLSLINDVLDMSKIEAGSLNLFVIDNLDLKAVIKQVSSTASVLIGDNPVEFVTDIDENLPHIRGDEQRIRQILLNIVSNACKFTESGKITFKAETKLDEKQVLLSVQDTGAGIAPEDMDSVFEPFKQTSTGLRQGGGTGLGMPICKNLVEVHGGKLWVDSKVGVGSTFYVSLPIKSEKLLPTI